MGCREHERHGHVHGADCGHKAVPHRGHTDYLHDGHLHAQHEEHADEHQLDVDRRRPASCAPVECGDRHGEACGHAPVPHGGHTDYEVKGALHHPHGDHCDLHGKL